MTTARPILFAAPMIRALLEGRKTQTRRIIKDADDGVSACMNAGEPFIKCEGLPWMKRRCPYGKPGNYLWVREAWRVEGKHTDTISVEEITVNRSHFTIWRQADVAFNDDFLGKVRLSIHMPRCASRMTLELTKVRVERIQEISEDDVLSEGISECDGMFDDVEYCVYTKEMGCVFGDSKPSFRQLWESINGRASWSATPWVWALTFKVHHCNVDKLLSERAA